MANSSVKAERPLRDVIEARSFVEAERPSDDEKDAGAMDAKAATTEVPRIEAEISHSVEPVFSTTLDRMGGEAMSVKAERPLKDAIEDGPVGYKVSPVVRERKSARFAIN